eukprot:m.31146 g.31146  ORF g.31146 m.31146 type:complete len:348 (+) comp8285_c0_seq1:186-1229(+)
MRVSVFYFTLALVIKFTQQQDITTTTSTSCANEVPPRLWESTFSLYKTHCPGLESDITALCDGACNNALISMLNVILGVQCEEIRLPNKTLQESLLSFCSSSSTIAGICEFYNQDQCEANIACQWITLNLDRQTLAFLLNLISQKTLCYKVDLQPKETCLSVMKQVHDSGVLAKKNPTFKECSDNLVDRALTKCIPLVLNLLAQTPKEYEEENHAYAYFYNLQLSTFLQTCRETQGYDIVNHTVIHGNQKKTDPNLQIVIYLLVGAAVVGVFVVIAAFYFKRSATRRLQQVALAHNDDEPLADDFERSEMEMKNLHAELEKLEVCKSCGVTFRPGALFCASCGEKAG